MNTEKSAPVTKKIKGLYTFFEGNNIYLTGQIGTLDDEKLINDYVKENNTLYGEIYDYEDNDSVHLSKVSHYLQNTWSNEIGVWGKFRLLDTSEGNLLKHIISEGFCVQSKIRTKLTEHEWERILIAIDIDVLEYTPENLSWIHNQKKYKKFYDIVKNKYLTVKSKEFNKWFFYGEEFNLNDLTIENYINIYNWICEKTHKEESAYIHSYEDQDSVIKKILFNL
jgi:hypothetical protein